MEKEDSFLKKRMEGDSKESESKTRFLGHADGLRKGKDNNLLNILRSRDCTITRK